MLNHPLIDFRCKGREDTISIRKETNIKITVQEGKVLEFRIWAGNLLIFRIVVINPTISHEYNS